MERKNRPQGATDGEGRFVPPLRDATGDATRHAPGSEPRRERLAGSSPHGSVRAAPSAPSAARRQANALEAELLGTVSHELRTPLAAIKGYATTLLRHEHRLPFTERRAFLEAIGQASDRLEAVIEQL